MRLLRELDEIQTLADRIYHIGSLFREIARGTVLEVFGERFEHFGKRALCYEELIKVRLMDRALTAIATLLVESLPGDIPDEEDLEKSMNEVSASLPKSFIPKSGFRGLLRIRHIELMKKSILEEWAREGGGECEFSWYELFKALERLYPHLRENKKTVLKHLIVELCLGEIEFDKESRAFVYQSLLHVLRQRIEELDAELRRYRNAD
jgi:hypothetical protein